VSTLQSITNTAGGLKSTGNVWPAGSNQTPWYRLYHCADGTDTTPAYAGGWLHIRTPYPATNAASGIGWNPNIVEVVGFHTYSGEYTHDFKAIVNNSGYSDNTWYGSQIKVNKGNDSSTPVVYQSSSQYGGYQRVCIAVQKNGCCCVGWIWIRFWNNSGYWNSYPWATVGRASSTAYY
jgi:hypothetical protein